MSVLPCQHNDPLMLASQMFCVSVKSLCACSKMPDMRPVVKSWHDWINMALWCCCFFIVCVVFKIIVYLMFINTPPHANYDNSDINFTENSRYCTCGPVFWKRGFPLSLTAIFRALPYAAFISCLNALDILGFLISAIISMWLYELKNYVRPSSSKDLRTGRPSRKFTSMIFCFLSRLFTVQAACLQLCWHTTLERGIQCVLQCLSYAAPRLNMFQGSTTGQLSLAFSAKNLMSFHASSGRWRFL